MLIYTYRKSNFINRKFTFFFLLIFLIKIIECLKIFFGPLVHENEKFYKSSYKADTSET